MDKKQKDLAETLLRTASAIKAGHALHEDLKAMAFALGNMSSERFASIKEDDAGEGGAPAEDAQGATDTQENKEIVVKKAADTTAGEYWSKEASERVLHNLVFSVVGSLQSDASACRPDPVKGAALPKEIVPNGEDQVGVITEVEESVPAAAIPAEATPEIAETLESNMVEKAEATPVEKTASEAAPAEEKAEESAAPAEEKAPGFTQEACGITLASETLGYGVSISAAEQAQLDQLFA